MESPFYGNYWSHPTHHPLYSSNFRGTPVQPVCQNPVQTLHQYPAQPMHQYPVQPMHRYPTENNKPATKVVQIPVHFVGSGSNRSGSRVNIQKPEVNRSASALKIQKVFRGFLVRKYVKKIVSIRKEVDEIERKLLCSETAELIWSNERERLRVNETLMSLLLKLDSVRGIDSGVRDCRKAVIKKAVALQDRVDSIVSAGTQIVDEQENQCNDSIEICVSAENHEENRKSADQDEASGEKNVSEGGDDVASAVEKHEETADLNEVSDDSPNCGMIDEKIECEGGTDVGPTAEKSEEMLEESQDCPTNYDDEKAESEGEDDVAPDASRMQEESKECPLKDEKAHEMEGGDNVEVAKREEMQEEGRDFPMDESVGDGDERKRDRELLERMVEENGKMMRMMNELCKRNEVQTRMLNSLTQRVEQLEKAFVCDKLKNKKKRRNPPS